MTNHWIDIRNADRIMIIGSNAAENHPISFKWVTAAKDRGARLISVDPRFTRTSSKADVYAVMRSGCDIAFIGGMIRWVLEDMQGLTPTERARKYNVEYLAYYTNAALIIDPGYEGPDNTAHPGKFVGWTENLNPQGPDKLNLGSYDKTKWKYGVPGTPAAEQKVTDNSWTKFTDLDPNCVLRLLWEHFERYDTTTVCSITGTAPAVYEEVCRTYAESGAPDKAGTIMYAMGTTQHTYGTQNIRSYAILQLLLGNIGVAGGGINALRGTSNVQGSTDMCLLGHILPGYLAQMTHKDDTLDNYINVGAKGAKDFVTPQFPAGTGTGTWWSPSWWWYNAGDPNYRKYMVSLLTAWYGKDNVQADGAGKEGSTVFNYLPKAKNSGGNYTHQHVFEALRKGIVKGMMTWGQNPAVGGPDSEGERKALENLEWLVVADLFETETAAFWKRPKTGSNELVDYGTIDTTVYLLPAACSYEKQGSISNSGRWAQWRYRAIHPIGQAKPDLAIIDELTLKLKALYVADTTAPNREAITELQWGYRTYGDYVEEADPNAVALEINGYDTTTGVPVTNFVSLKSDGTTCSGNWLYCGMFDVATGRNKAKDRGAVDDSPNQIGLYSNWTWCWPINRRIIYNRASVDFDGKPYDPEHPVIQYKAGSHDAGTNKCTWLGDVPDGPWSPVNLSDADGLKKTLPFIMQPEGVAHIWGAGRAEGPLPEAYEPWESPLETNLMTGVDNDPQKKRGAPGFNNPCCFVGDLTEQGEAGQDAASNLNKRGWPGDYPCVGMTYRVSEMWQAGQMTRNLPWLNELQPQVFAEMGTELAGDLGVKSGDKVRVSTARGYVDAVAIVTGRFRRLTIGTKKVDQVGVPWHWGFMGLSSAPHSAGNILTPHVGDANTTIPEYKTFLCKVEKV